MQTGISGLALKMENMEKICQSQPDYVFVLCKIVDWPQLAVLLRLWIQVSTEDWPEKQSKLGLSQMPPDKTRLILKLN